MERNAADRARVRRAQARGGRVNARGRVGVRENGAEDRRRPRLRKVLVRDHQVPTRHGGERDALPAIRARWHQARRHQVVAVDEPRDLPRRQAEDARADTLAQLGDRRDRRERAHPQRVDPPAFERLGELCDGSGHRDRAHEQFHRYGLEQRRVRAAGGAHAHALAVEVEYPRGAVAPGGELVGRAIRGEQGAHVAQRQAGRKPLAARGIAHGRMQRQTQRRRIGVHRDQIGVGARAFERGHGARARRVEEPREAPSVGQKRAARRAGVQLQRLGRAGREGQARREAEKCAPCDFHRSAIPASR